jgi:integrase
MATAQPIRDPEQVRALAAYYLDRGDIRNHVLVIMGVNTALRISDLLRMTWDDVYDFDKGCVRRSVSITEHKTGKPKVLLLNDRIVKALRLYSYAAERGAFLINNKHTGKAISRIQAYRILHAAAEVLEFGFSVSCHTLRKTFGYLAWKAGEPLAVIMEIYNHSSFAVTRRYLGVSQDDKDAVYRKIAEIV